QFKLNAIVGAGLVPALCRVGKQNNKRAKCNLPPVYFYFKIIYIIKCQRVILKKKLNTQISEIRNPKLKCPLFIFISKKRKNNKSTFTILLGYKSNRKTGF